MNSAVVALRSFWSGLTPVQCRDTGFAIIILVHIAGYFNGALPTSVITVCCAVLALAWPRLLTPFAFLWFGLATAMGKIVSTILLSLVFFLVLTPIGMIRRFLGNDSLALRCKTRQAKQGLTNINRRYSKLDLRFPY